MISLQIISDVLALIVAIEALFIMILEMFFSRTKMAQKSFDLSMEYLFTPDTKISMANQGLYNGFIGVGILMTMFVLPQSIATFNLYLFIGFVVVAAIFGGLTANKKIIITQGLPAALALISLFITNNI
ncbi:hypothetical protein FD43_GL000125 [Apilactobacillus kunkeei DSM 12361 = ATCC 700308]|uniref:Integral membrane protein n=1 Tax=Apilactobacillus kunkeei DSM 12361 = ATCC 700308 TaxID=1423768 RepID=A0A0R1G1H3_9LACO|nr:Uncharacterized protein RZ79_07940 [Apilactobacillus kunkeei DSM 12361 = ATCC 700308]KRK25178.1 hypothetical protein FD43_GL000125 [Apilactobacillus kunkeei DSM 12361 = ATCC 700308]